MHEVGIAQDVLTVVFKELETYDFSSIDEIELSVGEFNMLTQESLQNAFDLVAENTKAKGAVIKVTPIPGMEIEIAIQLKIYFFRAPPSPGTIHHTFMGKSFNVHIPAILKMSDNPLYQSQRIFFLLKASCNFAFASRSVFQEKKSI